MPIADPKLARESKIEGLEGEIPSPINPPSGCYFRTRCPYAVDRCAQVVPPLEHTDNGSEAACIRWEEIKADPDGARTRAREQ